MIMNKPFATRVVPAIAALLAIGGAAIALRERAPLKAVVLPDIPEVADPNATLLPNGWRVTPAGRSIALMGDLPLGMQVTPDGKYLVVTTSGFHNQSLTVISLADEKVVQAADIFKTYRGLAVSPDGANIYVSPGGQPSEGFLKSVAGWKGSPAQIDALRHPLMRYSFDHGHFSIQPGIAIPAADGGQRYIMGIETGPDGAVYVADYSKDTVFKLSGSDYSVLGSAAVGHDPYTLSLSPDRRTLAAANWAGGSVSLIDPAAMQVKAEVQTGNHPNALAWTRDGRLFVTNAGSNSVSVIKNGQVVETIKTSLDAQQPVGSTPDAVVASPDGSRVYVANADNNDVAVIDTRDPQESKLIGFIPTGWYPSSLAISPDGKRLFVGVGKGLRSMSNATAGTRVTSAQTEDGYRYDAECLSGAVSVVDAPSDAQLQTYTNQVTANTPKPTNGTDLASELTAKQAFAQIKHVVYIIRENRTYDQVFGDITSGNGDANLCLFGEKVTPNAHALAERYVLLDNLYCNGEVSEDGHSWCDDAYASDFKERAWVNSYSGRGEPSDDSGMNGSPVGSIWDNAARHGLTYKNYGEASSFKSSPDSPPIFTGPKSLDGHASYDYSQIPWFGKGRDNARADIFIADMHKGEETGDWPQLMVMSLPEDHTQGLQAGAYTPTANVGENDQALGKIVDAVSHSKFWKDTAIFVIEDDAQNGPDHVDSHRTVGLVISPYIRQGVDSTMYSQASFVHTMELILGLPPMTQYDQNATPLYNSFGIQPRLEAYDLLPAGVDVEARNPRKGAGEEASDKLDLSAPDRADPDKLNAILWHALRPGVPMPAPTRSAYRAHIGQDHA